MSSENDGLRVKIGRSGSVVEPPQIAEPTIQNDLQPKSARSEAESLRGAAPEPSTECEAPYEKGASPKPKVSCNFCKSDLKDFFSLLSRVTEKPIELSPDVGGQITMRLDDVSCDQALDTVVRLYRLQVTKTKEGFYISPSGTK